MPSSSKPTAAVSKPIRIAALDDHSIIRAIIRTIAEDAPDMELAWSAHSIADAREKLASDVPDLVLVDVTLPDGEGYEFIEEALKQHPHVPMLVISMHHEERYARRAHAAGARGYVMKNISPHDLVHLIQRVLRGEMVFDPALALH
ncbi:response regulator transcription factor [Phragmitibacter flavus]|uniref:Response regulator transcription factor n=1 Tax=Phragmitibacter flavus TaxID=2576071 RepID=A0A5R8KIS7_9BACT|nr:response regulator [Phragmitibacter flavus]TLD72228.1 response regulator transcription factor [Phragmitibacter flavus]